MMNELMQKIALDCGLLNYVDLETPRHYFVHADIEEEDIESPVSLANSPATRDAGAAP